MAWIERARMTAPQIRMAYWISLAVAAMSLTALGLIDQHLKGPITPLGIVSYQLCAYTANCADMVASWQGHTLTMAAMSLGLDYLFMVAYPAAICFGLLVCAGSLSGIWQRLAMWLAAVVWLAGLADAIENYHLFQMLTGHPLTDHAWPAAVAATLKFVVLVPALLLWLWGSIRHLSATRR